MAKNTVPIIIGAVIFGLLAIGLTLFSVMKGAAPPPPQTGTSVAKPPASLHFVARRPIYPRTIITSDMLEESESGEANAAAVTTEKAIIGSLANRTIQAGETVTGDALTAPIARVIPANIPISAGLRAVAIWVDPLQTAAGLIDAGDHVDVIAVHDITVEKSGNQVVVGTAAITAGRTIAQDLQVLAVDKSLQTPAAAAGAPNPSGQPAAGAQPGTPPAVNAAPTPAPPPGQEQRIRVILAAPPEIAQRLVAANSKGKLHITIRNPNSRDRFPQPESREYPSRIAAGPPLPRTGTPAASSRNSGGNGNNDGGGRNYSPPASEPPMPNFGTIAPGPIIRDNTPTFPQASPEKDVTVIRGTEKTRVIVPR